MEITSATTKCTRARERRIWGDGRVIHTRTGRAHYFFPLFKYFSIVHSKYVTRKSPRKAKFLKSYWDRKQGQHIVGAISTHNVRDSEYRNSSNIKWSLIKTGCYWALILLPRATFASMRTSHNHFTEREIKKLFSSKWQGENSMISQTSLSFTTSSTVQDY